MFCFGLTDDDGQAQPYKMHVQFLVHKPFALFLFFPSSGQFLITLVLIIYKNINHQKHYMLINMTKYYIIMIMISN